MRESFSACPTAPQMIRFTSTARNVPSPREGSVNQMLEAFVSLQNRLALLRDERGQTMAEYGVVLAVIALIVVVALTALSGAISGTLGTGHRAAVVSARRSSVRDRSGSRSPPRLFPGRLRCR